MFKEPSVFCCNTLFASSFFEKKIVDVSAFPAIAEVIADEDDFPDNRSLICVLV